MSLFTPGKGPLRSPRFVPTRQAIGGNINRFTVANFGLPGSDSVLRGMNFGTSQGPSGSSFGPVMVYGFARDNAVGRTSPPSGFMPYVGYIFFEWSVNPGANTLTVSVLQPQNSAPFPTMVAKANSDIGLLADVTGTSPGSTDWSDISITIVAVSAGAVDVELHNNLHGLFDPTNLSQIVPAPCWWDDLR